MNRMIAAAFALALLAAPAWADDADAGAVEADFLRLPVGAASVAQGEAFAARAEGIASLPYNPAGLAGSDSVRILLEHNEHFLGVRSEFLGLSAPVGRWFLGAGVTYLDYGTLVRRTITAPGGAGTFGADAAHARFGVAREVWDGATLGASVSYFAEQIDDAERDGVAFDVGIQVAPRVVRRLEVGAVLRNLGPQVSFDGDKDQIALEGAVGFSWRTAGGFVRLSGEAVFPRRQEAEFRAGIEVRPWDPLALRVGWNDRNDVGSGLTAGAGFTYRNIDLDYAYIPFGPAGHAHRGSLTIGF